MLVTRMPVTKQGYLLFTLEMINAIKVALEQMPDERQCVLELKTDLYGRVYICMSLSASKTQPASSTNIVLDAEEWNKNNIIKVDFHKVQDQGISGGFVLPDVIHSEEALALTVRMIKKFIQ